MSEIVVIGLGQLGRVFAGGLLRAGHTVVPLNRGDDMAALAQAHPAPALVLVAVAENDLHAVLAALPEVWKPRAALIQNELLPRDWQAHGYSEPTVISVWFEKKKGIDAKPLIASPVAGSGAALLCRALAAIELPCREVALGDELLFELVRKNVYILTTNLAGLKTGGTVSQLWTQHEAFARQVANEVIDIQDALTAAPLVIAQHPVRATRSRLADRRHARSLRRRPRSRLHRTRCAGAAGTRNRARG